MGSTAPGALFFGSLNALNIMFAGGARGATLVEQGRGWSTWTYSDSANLVLAAQALIEAGFTTVDMRYRDGGAVREVYAAS